MTAVKAFGFKLLCKTDEEDNCIFTFCCFNCFCNKLLIRNFIFLCC